MRPSRASVSWFTALLLAGSPAAALTTVISQSRSVSASAEVYNGPPVSQSFSASDSGPFDQVASAHSQQAGTFQCCYVSAGIRQRSAIEEGHFYAVLGGSMSWDQFSGPAMTQSIYDVTFDLDAPSNYWIMNGLNQYFSWGTHEVTLRDEDGQVISRTVGFGYSPGTQPGEFFYGATSAILAPGRYRFTAQFDRGYATNFYSENQFEGIAELRLRAIPEPATGTLLGLGLGAISLRAQIRRLRPAQ